MPLARWLGFVALALACSARLGGPPPPVTEDDAVEGGESRDADRTLLADGRIVIDPARVVHVGSPVSGRVARVDAVAGASVARGAVLVAIEAAGDPTDLYRAEADVIEAGLLEKRLRQLTENDGFFIRDLERAQDALRVARARLQVARAGRTYELRAPVDGTVISCSAVVGALVAPEPVTIAEHEPAWVVADVDADRAAAIAQAATVDALLAEQVLPCVHAALEDSFGPTGDERVGGRFRCALADPQGPSALTSGAPARLRFVLP